MSGLAWIFLLYNPKDSKIVWPAKVKYAVHQKENTQNGIHVLRGYVEFKTPQCLAVVRKLLPKAHWEMRRGTCEQARGFATRVFPRLEGPFEYGTWE